MDMVWKISKGLLKLTWSIFKLVLLVVKAAIEVSEKKNKPVCGAFEAHMRLEEGTISHGEFYTATHQHQD